MSALSQNSSTIGTPVGFTTQHSSPGTNGTTSTTGTEELLMSPINNNLAQLLSVSNF